MNPSEIFLPFMQAAPAVAGGPDNSAIMNIVMIVGFIAIFYFLIIRPQNKKQKETQRMLDEVKKGDTVVTIGGLHAQVISVEADTVLLKADENVKLKYNKSAIATVVDKTKAEAPAEKK